MRSRTYSPAIEQKWHRLWASRASPRPAHTQFSMVLPPPNVTGALHIGHALTIAIQDAIVRWNKMKGKETIWIPGFDHAGIATQTVVEKFLAKQIPPVTRHDLGREEFLNRVMLWKDQYADEIKMQMQKLGNTMDWSKEVFTMDKVRSEVVVEAFITLFEAGLIRRDSKIVNWCTYLQTVLSDIEVDHFEVDRKKTLSIPSYGQSERMEVEVGVMHCFKYPVDGMESLEVHTTRPETIPGDTALAIHPNDHRYSKYHGKFAFNPVTKARIPIITDSQLVDMEFGTGIVKVTPAHDSSDYDCALRNNLSFLNILNLDGTLNSNAGEYLASQGRFKARKMVIDLLKSDNLYLGEISHRMNISLCSRSGDIIEPIVMPQWFLDCKEMARNASADLEQGKITIEPEHHHAIWHHFMNNIKDWCISRQLWWGHQIPAYKIAFKERGGITDVGVKGKDLWIAARSENEAYRKAKLQHNLESHQITLIRDSDVLDTWFSSALFPLSVFGWPNCDLDFKKFYPLSLMETGSDILFFWVSRMVMLCTYLSGENPFKSIFLHPIVRDANGVKMSKSLGNVIDPIHVIEGISLSGLLENLRNGNLDVMEREKAEMRIIKDYPNGIPECGADALRFALYTYMVQSRQINLDIQRVKIARNFCNKIWQAFWFFMTNRNELRNEELEMISYDSNLDELDEWILTRLNALVCFVNLNIEEIKLGACVNELSKFFLTDFCDFYIESCKPALASNDRAIRIRKIRVLREIFSVFFKLSHPFLPHITEELWHLLEAAEEENSILDECYPNSAKQDSESESYQFVESVREMVHSVRSIVQKRGVSLKQSRIVLHFEDEGLKGRVLGSMSLLRHFVRCAELSVVSLSSGADMQLVIPGVYAQVEHPDAVSSAVSSGLAARAEKLRLRLSNAEFRARAPASVIADVELQLSQLERKLP